MKLKLINMKKLPNEIINLITDYISYKSLHKRNFQKVLNTIRVIDGMIDITPRIAKECWGKRLSLKNYKYLYYSRYIWNPRERSDEENDEEYEEYHNENRMDFYKYDRSCYF